MSTKTKFHRDGTVTVWNVFLQQHERKSSEDWYMQAGGLGATCRPDAVLPTLNAAESERIIRLAGRNIRGGQRAMRYRA